MKLRALFLSVALLAASVAPASAQGWRPAIKPAPTDAEWIVALDRQLAPIHGTIDDTLSLVDRGTDIERDAYLTIIQQQAAKGIAVLDRFAPARACAIDYVAAERVMFLMFGDSIDAWVQFQAGSSQARSEVTALVPPAVYILRVYGDVLRAAATCEPAPEPVATEVQGDERVEEEE